MKSPRDLDPDEMGSEALRLIGLIAAEFLSDPKSVQCFDARIVEQAIALAAEQIRRNKSSVFYGI